MMVLYFCWGRRSLFYSLILEAKLYYYREGLVGLGRGASPVPPPRLIPVREHIWDIIKCP